jgi:hypothetical protein
MWPALIVRKVPGGDARRCGEERGRYPAEAHEPEAACCFDDIGIFIGLSFKRGKAAPGLKKRTE